MTMFRASTIRQSGLTAARTYREITHRRLTGAGLIFLLLGCNNYPFSKARISKDDNPNGVFVIEPTRPAVPQADAGVKPFGPPVKLGPDAGEVVPTDPQDAASTPAKLPDGGLAKVPDAPVQQPDTRPPPDTAPVEKQTPCPAGQVRIHVRDIWSSGVTPTMNTMQAPPTGVLIVDPTGNYIGYGARVDAANCSYYSVCIPNTISKVQIKSIGADSCPGSQSGAFDISSVNKSAEFWVEYTGASSSLQTDYTTYPNVPVGNGKFNITSDASKLTTPPCKIGVPPDQTPPSGYTKIHFRWPWSDPAKTGYPGSGCGDDKLGYSPPPYPSSLKVTGIGGCEMQAMLEFQDGTCPWYYVMIPNTAWTGTTSNIVFRFPDDSKGLWTPNIPLPARTANEYWIAYAGAPDNTAASVPKCMDWSQQPNTYFIYASNPGPGYQNCGGSVAPVDPCSPPQPNGYHTVHFRYIWAGQKTFTFFPKPELMPHWIEMEINGKTANKIICYREQDRPWYNCPVPDAAFQTGATWRAVDKTHNPEWNTVAPRPFPSTPKDYWLRWYYGKPDIPRTTDPQNFKFFDYYPDGTNGDWSATGVWNDDMCAPKPPATPVKVGFNYGGWFPYKSTQYMYPFGASLAYIYPDTAKVQDLFDAFTFERYQLWKQNWVKYDADACGTGTARVDSGGWPGGTVSEGQGYGIAMAAAIGDKELLDKLWLFARHFLSKNAKWYCGGLMGWKWSAPSDCRPLDTPCDPDKAGDCTGNGDSAFDGDVDLAIGLVYAALQWPSDYEKFAIDWLTKMECEINTKYDGKYNYPTKGDTWDKNCQNIKSDATSKPCDYQANVASGIFMDYYPPGYFRAFGDFMAAKLGTTQKAANGQTHRDFWYKTAETVYKMYEMCYDEKGVNPGLVGQSGDISKPCNEVGGGEPYEWGRALWRVGIDAAWFGDNTSLPENAANSSPHYFPKSQMQAKLDNSQAFFNDFYKKNPVEANANRFSSICHQLGPSGTVTNCDPAYGHNSYTVNLALCSYVSLFDNKGATTSEIRQAAIEESISTTIQNDQYFQESLGVYSILFMTGNFPNPLAAAAANKK
jgi:hypothetical protein